MKWNRGDVVLCAYPNSDLRTAKRRPALVVQADRLDTGIAQTILVMITTNPGRAGHPSRVVVQAGSPTARNMGLVSDSVVMMDNLATVLNNEIYGVIGTCDIMPVIDTALRHTLSL